MRERIAVLGKQATAAIVDDDLVRDLVPAFIKVDAMNFEDGTGVGRTRENGRLSDLYDLGIGFREVQRKSETIHEGSLVREIIPKVLRDLLEFQWIPFKVGKGGREKVEEGVLVEAKKTSPATLGNGLRRNLRKKG